MNGKGSTQRPRQVSQEEFGDRWDETFNDKKSDDSIYAIIYKCFCCGKRVTEMNDKYVHYDKYFCKYCYDTNIKHRGIIKRR